MTFGPMAHVGWAKASSTRTPTSSSRLRPRNGPPEAVSSSRRTAEREPACETLVQRAVLGVDRQDLGAGGAAGRLHHGCAGNDRLLVGQGQSAAGTKGSQGDRQPGEPDDRVEDHVGQLGDGTETLGTDHDVGPLRQAAGQLGGGSGITHGHDLGSQTLGLIDQHLDRSVGPEGDDVETAGPGFDHVHGLGSDGTGGADQAHGGHAAVTHAATNDSIVWSPRLDRPAGRGPASCPSL